MAAGANNFLFCLFSGHTSEEKKGCDMQQSNEQRKNGEAMQSKSAWQRRQKQQQRKQATIIQWFRKTLTIG
jgi:hypothetical protein